MAGMDVLEGASTVARRRRGSRLSRVVALLMAAVALVAVRPAPASAAEWWDSPTAQWYDGSVSYSQVLNCVSIIQGAPYYEKGVGAYIGYVADPTNARPAANDKGWIRYRVYGMGNPCPGGSYFRPRFYLPVGWSWDTTRQIACAYDGSGGSAPQANCPGWSNMDASNAYWNNGSGSGGNLWGVAQGHYWEFQFPVTVGGTVSGAVLDAHLDVADGNSNPQMLLRNNNIYVFNGSTPSANPITVMYDQPSSYDSATQPAPATPGTPTKYGMVSAYQAVLGYKTVSVRWEISTDPGFGSILGSETINNVSGFNAINAWIDWSSPIPPLTVGQTYYWRGVITPTAGGPPVVGAVQSFVLEPGGGVVEDSVTGVSGGGVGTTGGGTLGGALTPITVPVTTPTPTPQPAPPASLAVGVPAKASAAKGVAVKVTCTAACTGKVSVVVSKKVAKQLRLKSVVLGTRRVSLAAAGATTVKVALSKAARKAIARKGKAKGLVKVSVSSGGRTLTSQRSLTLKR